MKRIFLGLFLVMFSIGTFLTWQHAGRARLSSRLNILVVSACSLRSDHLGSYNSAAHTPKIDEWAKTSVYFSNMIAERPWDNFSAYSFDTVTRPFLIQEGYQTKARHPEGTIYNIPPIERDEDNEWFWSEKAILHDGPSLNELKQVVTQRSDKPFYVFAHVKYMHYPYFDDVNLTDADLHQLSSPSRELLARYRAHPEKYEVQLPLIELLFNDFKLLQKKYSLNKIPLSAAGVISDSARDARWQASASFTKDLALAKELYDLKMARFDTNVGNILNLYGDEDLKRNTVVIFVGDHGEAFMEHGVIGHSVNTYEEMLKFPLFIKFPGSEKSEKIEAQFSHHALAQLVHEIVEGKVTKENLVSEAERLSPQYILSRNCANTIRSVRLKSEWKFIQNLNSTENELYDLRNDPLEKNNLITQKPDLAFQLEEYLVDHQQDLTRENFYQRHAQVCSTNG